MSGKEIKMSKAARNQKGNKQIKRVTELSMKQATFRNDFEISIGGCTREYRIRYNDERCRWDIYQTEPELNTACNAQYWKLWQSAKTLEDAFVMVSKTF